MSILKTHIRQELDLKQVDLVQHKLPKEALKHFDEFSNKIEHLTLSQKLDLTKKGYMVPIKSYYLKIKEFIFDKELEKRIEEKLHERYLINLPDIAKTSCKECKSIPKGQRSCEYFNLQLQFFLIFSSAIIYDEIKQYEKSKSISKELKQQIAIEFINSVQFSKKGYGLNIGRLIEFLIENDLYQKAQELDKESIEDRYKICADRLKELKDIGKYAKWKISDGLIFNKWISFWEDETQNVKNEVEIQSKLNELKKKNIKNPLLNDLVEIAQRILNRGGLNIHEDRINDKFTDFLETKGYIISDQKRTGNGLVDISLKNDSQNTIASIEATKYHSKRIVQEHLFKLLHKYNKPGHRTNYLLIYSFDKVFGNKWREYKNCINKIKDNDWDHPIQGELNDITGEFSTPINIKIGLSEHSCNKSIDDKVNVYHIFMNTYEN